MNDAPRTYDVIVIGAGPVGENLADRTQAAGLSTVIVESELVGGECSYWACMPSKALLRPALARADARRLPGLSHAVQGPLDAPAVLARRDGFTSHWKDDGQVGWLRSVDVDLVRGHGRLDGPRQVAVTTPDGDAVRLTARHAVAVCTGTTAALPAMPGIHDVNPWISRDATSAKKVPRRLAVVGGGVVAVEMATAWQALGSQVTLLVRGDTLLDKMEPFAGEMVADALREAGVDVRFGAVVSVVERDGAHGEVRVSVEGGARVSADEVLFAIGRRPHTGDIGLETVGLKPGGWLPVDDTCQVVDVEGGWLYAAGDVNHRALLTHQGKYQGRTAGDAIAARAAGRPLDDAPWGDHATTADQHAVPQVFFTDPEAAAVGLSAEQAASAGHRVKVVDVDFDAAQGANLYADHYRGHARMVVDLDREVLLGVTFAGPGVSELLHSATVAVAGEVPLKRLRHAIACFPTISEVWFFLLTAYERG
jgi:pyruvate/2-oxoglutarate dehydrogenase complex dihydrolipoamide dehydrogenase (E3) component